MNRRIIMLVLFICCFLGADAIALAAAPPAPVPRTGQDGDTGKGVDWPGPRFTGNGDRTVTDRLTGLAWTRDANPAGGYKTWQQALDFIRFLNNSRHLGRNDWRLPNVNEMESLVNKQPGLSAWLDSQGFENIRKDYYWTSTTYAACTSFAWSVGLHGGIVTGHDKTDGGLVWPVRGPGPGVLALPKTGQTDCYDVSGASIACVGTGQDGELQAGIAWPDPRFKENADLTVTDRLTGLVWSREGKAPGPPTCNPGTRKNGQGAFDHVKCLNTHNYLGRTDWRLPNRNELASLVNRGQSDTAAWLNSQVFSNVQAEGYWSSSAYPSALSNAWGVNMHDGAVTSFARKHRINVWPVRNGP